MGLIKGLFKLIALLVVLVIGLVIGIGFLAGQDSSSNVKVVVNASPAQIFAVVGNPKRTPEWLPKDVMDIKSVEVFNEGLIKNVAAGTLEAFGLKAATDDPTHRYVNQDDKYLDMQITSFIPGQKYMEKVVGGTDSFTSLFEDATWGFELKPLEGNANKTTLFVIGQHKAKRPFGVFLSKLMQWSGAHEQGAADMAKGIEAAIKGKEAAPAAPAVPAAP
ncbi:MAG: SRPBCC family protein [Planctomycetota bacterium]|jgi:hypothetical protein